MSWRPLSTGTMAAVSTTTPPTTHNQARPPGNAGWSSAAREETTWAKQQDHDEQHQADDLLVFGADPDGADVFDNAKQEPGHERAQNATHSREDYHHQCLECPGQADRGRNAECHQD